MLIFFFRFKSPESLIAKLLECDHGNKNDEELSIFCLLYFGPSVSFDISNFRRRRLITVASFLLPYILQSGLNKVEQKMASSKWLRFFIKYAKPTGKFELKKEKKIPKKLTTATELNEPKPEGPMKIREIEFFELDSEWERRKKIRSSRKSSHTHTHTLFTFFRHYISKWN